jgi:hypothetical protein
MKWCCFGFKVGYESAGRRGGAILVGRDSVGAPDISLQFRAVDKGREDSIRGGDAPISLVEDIRFAFCPWCGRNALKWYRKNIDALFRPDLKIPL